jgi:hypothetical protein
MKISLPKILSVVSLTVFISYWILIPLLTLPRVPFQKTLAKNFELPAKAFVFNWRFFARPGTYNQRMYLLSRQENSSHVDTIELIEPIVLEKQQQVPFNQQANIPDHFIHYYAAKIHRSAARQKSTLEKDHPSQPDSFYKKQLTGLVSHDKNARPALIVLDRYCRVVLEMKYPNNYPIEYKYIITAQLTPPFDEKTNQGESKENFIYDSGFLKY